MSNYKCRECGEALYKCECEPEVTEELRAHHFNTSGIYSSDADIAVWSKSISAKLPSADTQHEPSAINNGGSTDYYKLNPAWKECGDIIEARTMNYSQGNIFKAAFCFNLGRHEATTYERELNKIIYFAKRELDAIQKG